jgi:hypothetical protein
MTAILFAFLLSQSQPAAPPACTAPEHRQFDFWVGDWVVRDPKGQQVGTNRIERIENGCGLEEHWTGAGGSGTGRSLNAYRRQTGQWHQTWIGSNGGIILLDGKFADGKMVLEGKGLRPNGSPVFNRITWSQLEGGIVRQVWEQSTDEGKTWTISFDGRYSHRKKAAGAGGR